MFHPNATNNTPCTPTIKPVHKSEFLGTFGGFIGTNIKAIFVNLFFYVLCYLYLVLFAGFVLFFPVFVFSISADAAGVLLSIFLFGAVPLLFLSCLGAAWAFLIRCRWNAKNTIISGHPVCFQAGVFATAGTFIKWSFLSMITCGIYALWLPILIRKWKCAHFCIDFNVQFADVDHSSCEHNQTNILNKK